MGTQYYCLNEKRKDDIIKHPVINGIDYLEVLDNDAPSGSPPQQTLLVRCLKPLPGSISEKNVEIEGGVRITPVKAEWAARASDTATLFAEGLINEAERDFFLALKQPKRVLVVRTDSSGDFSLYTLNIVESPTPFDTILNSVDFSFKVECPTDFDCEDEDDCPPEVAEEPVINYLAKDYASFRQLILDRLSVIMPDWEERNPADLGITLVELLAYAGDYLSYYQDAAASEAYLETARRRPSIRRHAQMLDYQMHEGVNARAWVAFTVDDQGDTVTLPKVDITGQITRLLTRVPASVIIDEEDWDEIRQIHRPQVFELLHDITLYKSHNKIDIYTWGEEECCLPKGATKATLKDDLVNPLQLEVGDVILFEEFADPGTGQKADADPAHRQAVRLTAVTSSTDALYTQPVLEIEWEAEDALTFPLCISAMIDGVHHPGLSVARGNVALCDHGRTVEGEELDEPAGLRRYRPQLEETGITHHTAYQNGALSANTSLSQDPRKALPAVTLTRTDETWVPQPNLLDSDGTMTHFVVEMENNRKGTLRFGDDTFGKSATFENGEQLQAAYRIGNGTEGNVGAEAIAHVVANISGVIRVRNPIPAQGGADAESMEEVRQYAPQAFRTQERAVTEADYAMVAERHKEVQKAKATRRWTGSWHTLFITVDRIGGREVDAEFEEKLRLHLDSYRLAGHDVEIEPPSFISLDIGMTVCIEDGYFQGDIKEALLEAFSSGNLPDGSLGFFHPDNFTFGQPVYLSQIIARAMEITGVKWVKLDNTPPHRFKRWGKPQRDEITKGLINIDRLEIARLNNDPSQPEHGKIEFFLEGGH